MPHIPAAARRRVFSLQQTSESVVGADDPVRPAVRTHEHGRTPANPYHVCRGRCPHRPARGTSVFTIYCGKFVVAQRADRGVRPYRMVCVCADSFYKFAIAHCRVDVGIDPYGHHALSPFVVCFRLCILRGRGKLRPYVTTKRVTAQNAPLFSSSVSLRLTPSPQGEGVGFFIL